MIWSDRMAVSAKIARLALSGRRAIEDPSFQFEHLSLIAELETWRKEINRPFYHIHKSWAQRLGSVFRAILLGSFTPLGSDVLDVFYQPVRLTGALVFDPFMGSGTSVGEALPRYPNLERVLAVSQPVADHVWPLWTLFAQGGVR